MHREEDEKGEIEGEKGTEGEGKRGRKKWEEAYQMIQLKMKLNQVPWRQTEVENPLLSL